MKPVPADGHCIIHAFRENLLSIGCKVTFDDLTTCLQNELQSKKYQIFKTDDINIVNELEQYLEHPLSQHGKAITDLFLDALGVAFKVNINILQSDCSKCYFFDQLNTSNLFGDTLYFVRTESLHFDPAVPSNYAEDRNINTDRDSDASIVLIDEVNADDVGEIKDIKTEIPRTSMETDFLTDRSDTGNERTAEELPLHYEHMDYSIDANKQNEEENPLQSATSDPAVPGGFDYVNPPAKLIFQFLLVEPTKYEVMTPLKRVRKNKVYTIRDY